MVGSYDMQMSVLAPRFQDGAKHRIFPPYFNGSGGRINSPWRQELDFPAIFQCPWRENETHTGPHYICEMFYL